MGMHTAYPLFQLFLYFWVFKYCPPVSKANKQMNVVSVVFVVSFQPFAPFHFQLRSVCHPLPPPFLNHYKYYCTSIDAFKNKIPYSSFMFPFGPGWDGLLLLPRCRHHEIFPLIFMWEKERKIMFMCLYGGAIAEWMMFVRTNSHRALMAFHSVLCVCERAREKKKMKKRRRLYIPGVQTMRTNRSENWRAVFAAFAGPPPNFLAVTKGNLIY